MKKRFERLKNERTALWLLLCGLLIIFSTVTRMLLAVKSFREVSFTPLNDVAIFGLGFLYDLFNAVYFTLPFVLYLWLVPERIFQKKWHRRFLYGLFFIFSFMIIFNGIAEWLFWDEFNVRFNFIAVDYLVYTNEVVGNIRQSYPLELIIVITILLSAGIVFLVRSRIDASGTQYVPFKKRTGYLAYYALAFVIILFSASSKYHRFSNNEYVNELAGNGLYELFAAYRNNELNYQQFYKAEEMNHAFEVLRKELKTSEASFMDADPHSINRNIVNAGPEKKMNVILVSVESFSADFMKLFGNTENITPELDSLAAHSLVFTNLFATGTRTVRGLEALALCVPPTPGQSIVRRPENEGLFSLGKVFKEKGYTTKFIYGGYSYFDNMGYFFGNNTYQVVDRSALKSDEIDYENIWGVADENLFDLAIKEIDANSSGEPIFAQVMTTSNHRPFTYPDGRIDIPSHTGRAGAVKYTDYSIGRFIKQASSKPWFKNTLFVIVADHCASSAGKTELPVEKYHIPMLIYSPGTIEPGVMTRLMSQIDIGPTILGMLNFSYASKFYGYDIFKLEAGRERAFISTYQTLGYLKGGKLVTLSPQFKSETFQLSDKLDRINKADDQQLTSEAIAWYQCASYAFKNGLMK
ncbi:MAG: sulfatase-like hydrolase/transferase [Chryseolinea sp.]